MAINLETNFLTIPEDQIANATNFLTTLRTNMIDELENITNFFDNPDAVDLASPNVIMGLLQRRTDIENTILPNIATAKSNLDRRIKELQFYRIRNTTTGGKLIPNNSISMPYLIRKISKNKYQVLNQDTGKIHAKHTSKANAEAQVRLLQSLERK